VTITIAKTIIYRLNFVWGQEEVTGDSDWGRFIGRVLV